MGRRTIPQWPVWVCFGLSAVLLGVSGYKQHGVWYLVGGVALAAVLVSVIFWRHRRDHTPWVGVPRAASFSQAFCRVRPYHAGGLLTSSLVSDASTATVADACLELVGSAGLIDRSPLSSVVLETPTYAEAVGEVAFVRMDGHPWAVDFSLCGWTARRQSWGRARRFLSRVFPLGSGLVASRALGKQLVREFSEALLRGGAQDRRPGRPAQISSAPGYDPT